MKKTIFILALVLILTACGSQPTKAVHPTVSEPVITPTPPTITPATSTPIPAPIPFEPYWLDSPLINTENPVRYANETLEYQGRDIYGTNLELHQDTRWSIGLEVNKLADDVGEASTGIVLIGYHPDGFLQTFALAYQHGAWNLLYSPNHLEGNYTYGHTLENLRNPVQNFELSISGDGHQITLKNDKGLNFVREIEEKLFDGNKKIIATMQVGPQTEIVLTNFTLSQLQTEAVTPPYSPPLNLSAITPQKTESGRNQYILHVAIDGNDTNSGTADEPLATIEHARDIARQLAPDMENDIIINIHGGAYTTTEPITFTQEDSGKNGYDIIYRAAENEKPIISGGSAITGWEKVSDQTLWKTTLPEDIGVFRQLYVNGKRAQRAGTEETIIGTRWDTGDFSERDGIRILSSSLPDFSRPQDLELHWIYDWKDMRLLVDDITALDENSRTIWMRQPYYLYALWMEGENHEWIPKYNIPFYVENAFELLDQPGEWYFNEDTREIFYWPRENEDLAEAETIVPQAQSLMEISGGLVGDEVHNLVFEGLTFAYAGWTRANEQGVFGWQAQNLIADTGWGEEMTPAHVQINAAHDIRIERCRFESLGAIGMHLGNNVSETTIQGNLFQDISNAAISAGHWEHAYITAPLLQVTPYNNLIANNLIIDVGVEYWGTPAISALYVNNLKILHNEVSNVPNSGISVGWGLAYTPDSTTSHDNLIQSNLITDLALYSRDAGGVYLSGQQPGTIADSNVTRRMKGDYACLYPDEGTAYITFTKNVCDTTPTWLHAHKNTIHDIQISDTYTNIQPMTNRGVNIQIENTVYVNGQNWPLEAQAIIDSAGLEEGYSYLYDWLDK